MLLANPFRKFVLAADNGAASSVAEKATDDDAGPEDGGEETGGGEETVETEGGGEDAGEGSEGPVDEAPAAPSLADVYRQHNLQGLPDDPTQLAEQWRIMQARAQEAETYRQQLQWLAHQRQQEQAAAQAAQQQRPVEKWKPAWGERPEYRREMLDMVTRNEAGELVPKPYANPSVLDNINKFAQWRETGMDQLLSDPVGTLKDGLMPLIQEQAYHIAAQIATQQQEQFYLAQETDKNREWAIDPNTGALSPAGVRWSNYFQFFREQGMDYHKAGRLAHKSLNGDLFEMGLLKQPEPTPAKPAAQSEAEKKLGFLKGAARQPNRSGTTPKRTQASAYQNGDDMRAFDRLEEAWKNMPDSAFR